MKTSLVRIGNSLGIRIPKSIREQCGFEDVVELEVRDGALVVSASVHPRVGWEADFKLMASLGEDKPIDRQWPATDWERTEWGW
jgi:antitoxin MazE